MTSNFISQLTRSLSGETMELVTRKLIVNRPLHLMQPQMGIHNKECLLFEEYGKRVTGCDHPARQDEPHWLGWLMKG